jgi:hypothetical protein
MSKNRSEERPHKSQPCLVKSHSKSAVWLTFVFMAVTTVWTTAMLSSLRWRFLDPFVAGTVHTRIGLDFFQTPRAFKNLVAGNNLFLTEISDYGPYSTSYYYHPFAAIIVGPWTAPFEPWTAYCIFVGASVILLAFSGWILGTAFKNPAHKAFAYLALFCSLPTYLLLWNAQLHVLLIVAVSLILAGLLRLAQEPQAPERYLFWIQIGLLLSLLSKPTVVLMLPVFCMMPETRRKAIAPLLIYAVVSLVFLFVPRLNLGNYNAVHWQNIIAASGSPAPVYSVVYPRILDYVNNDEIYSLPMFIWRVCGQLIPLVVFKLPLAFVLLVSLSPLVLQERWRRVRVATVAVALCILVHYLTYFLTYEYHYTTLLPLLPVLLWLWQTEPSRWLRRLLMASLLALSIVLLPTPNFLSEDISEYWTLCVLERIVPVCAAFVLLTVYGAAATWLGVRGRGTEFRKWALAQLWPASGSAAIVGVLLATVFVAAWATLPHRLRVPPANWRQEEWTEHFQDLVSRPGLEPMIRMAFHCELAVRYTSLDPRLARQHFDAAHRLVVGDTEGTLVMATFLANRHRPKWVAELLAEISPETVTDPELRQLLETLRKRIRST